MKKSLFILILSLAFVLFPKSVFASTSSVIYLNNNQFSNNGYFGANSGTNTFHISLSASESIDKYFVFTMCTDSPVITDWTDAGSGNEFNIYSTNYSCMFPRSSYTGGHVVYIYGSTNWNNFNNCSVSLDNCFNDIYVSYWQSAYASWAFLYSSLSNSPFSIDYSTQSLINKNQEIINQNNTIINNQQQNTQSIINNQNANAQQAHQDSQDIKNAITSDDIPDNNSSQASEWASNNASDSVVSDMVLMPITLLNAFSNGFNGSCQAYNLGSLYGTNLTLPCINIQNYLGSTLWTIIDVLMSGFLIYGIGKKFVKVFNDFTNLKDSQVDELYGGGNE